MLSLAKVPIDVILLKTPNLSPVNASPTFWTLPKMLVIPKVKREFIIPRAPAQVLAPSLADPAAFSDPFIRVSKNSSDVHLPADISS